MSVCQEIYTRVTASIIAELERGVRPWMRPWNAINGAERNSIPLRHSGAPYLGINMLMLWGATLEAGVSCSQLMTYRQTQELGGQVRRAKHGAMVVFADRYTRTDTKDAGDAIEREIPFLKAYKVFNCDRQTIRARRVIGPAVVEHDVGSGRGGASPA